MPHPSVTTRPDRTSPSSIEVGNQVFVQSHYDVSADNWNALVNIVNSLLHVQIFDAVVPMNQDHVQLTHNLGSVPLAVVLAPVDNVGRCWYDMNTLSSTICDVYVASPPLDGGYLIKVILYY